MKKRLWAGIGTALVVLTMSAPAGGAAKLTKSCRAALAHADKVADIFSEYAITTPDTATDPDAALRARGKLLGLSARGSDEVQAYLAAAKKCRAGK